MTYANTVGDITPQSQGLSMICCHIVQALLELQRQQDSMRLSSTRDLTRRVSSSHIPPLPPGGTEADAGPSGAEYPSRSQSYSFTGALLWQLLPKAKMYCAIYWHCP